MGKQRRICLFITLAAGIGACAATAQTTVVTPRVTLQDAAVNDQDDMCIWIHPTSSSLSTVIASDKAANKLFVYDLEGNTVQTVAVSGKPGNIDIRYRFPLGGEQVDIVAYNDRDNNKVAIYQVDPDTRRITKADDGSINTGPNYGSCLYYSRKSRRHYAFTCAETGGGVEQYELSDNGSGKVTATRVRSWSHGKSEGCVADDEMACLYVGEEGAGVWKFGAEAGDSTAGELIARIGENGLVADVEGVTIYYAALGEGYIIASSQGNNSFKVYNRKPPHAFVKTFTVSGAQDTDGIDVTNVNLGSAFPKGIFTLHNGAPSKCPVLVCAYEDLGIATDTEYWNPRTTPFTTMIRALLWMHKP